MTPRGDRVNGVPLAERLATMTVDNFKADAPPAKFDELMKGVSTSCKVLGHSPEAATFARRCCFALVDHFGLNSLFDNLPMQRMFFRSSTLCTPQSMGEFQITEFCISKE